MKRRHEGQEATEDAHRPMLEAVGQFVVTRTLVATEALGAP